MDQQFRVAIYFHDPSSVRAVFLPDTFSDITSLSEIDADPPTESLGAAVHIFDIEIDEKRYVVRVAHHDIVLIKRPD